MALNPYMVTNTVTITWDNVSQRIPRGTIIDSPAPAGSNLANTIGAGNLVALNAQQTGGAPGEMNPVQRVLIGAEPNNPGQN